MKTLIVHRKPLRYPRGYNHRMMQPGEVFQALNKRDERVLLFSKRVIEAREEVEVPPPPQEVIDLIVPPVVEAVEVTEEAPKPTRRRRRPKKSDNAPA